MEAAGTSASANRAITRASHTASTAPRSSDAEKEDIEENLSAIIGRTGLFHRTLFAYEVVAMLCLALHNLVHGASASDEDHWCRLPDPPGNTTMEEWRDMNIPRDENGNMSRCLVYSPPDGEVTAGHETRAAVPCSERVFGNSGAMSIVKQWDLTCDRLWMRSACETVYTSGSFFGLILSGITADKIGRKPTICISAVVLEVVGISLSSVSSVLRFMCHRFLVSATINAIVYTQYIMLVEVVAMQWRALYLTFTSYGYIIGVVVNVVMLGDDVDWRQKQLIIMVPTTVLLCGFCLLPESPRWSLTNLRVEEAVNAVAYILRCNRATPDAIRAVSKKLRMEPMQTLHRRMSANDSASQYRSHRRTQAEELESPEKTVWELLVILTTQYQFSSLALGFCWFACSITFYGLAIDLKAGSINSLFQFALVLMVPIATYALIVWLGRRDVLAVSLHLICASCIAVAFLSGGSPSARFVALSSAWFFSNVAYTVLFVYATEIYPTVIRALSFNLGAGFGRIGTIIAPFLYEEGDSKVAAYLILAFTCGLSGFLVAKLPDTKEVHLPELVKPEENLFDFTPLRSPHSRPRGVMSVSPQDTGPSTSQVVPAFFKTTSSKTTTRASNSPDRKFSSWDKSKAKCSALSRSQGERMIKPAAKKLATATRSDATVSKVPSFGPEISVSKPAAGVAQQSASAGASAPTTEVGKFAGQTADNEEQKRASRVNGLAMPSTDQVFQEDRFSAGSPKEQGRVLPSGTSEEVAQLPTESQGICLSSSSTAVNPSGTGLPGRGPHLGDTPEQPSPSQPIDAAPPTVIAESMEHSTAAQHHLSPTSESVPADVVSPTPTGADAETASPSSGVSARPPASRTPTIRSSPSHRQRHHHPRPTSPKMDVEEVAPIGEASAPHDHRGDLKEVDTRVVQPVSARAVDSVKNSHTLPSPQSLVESAGSNVSAKPQDLDRSKGSPLKDTRESSSPKIKRSKQSKRRTLHADDDKDVR